MSNAELPKQINDENETATNKQNEKTKRKKNKEIEAIFNELPNNASQADKFELMYQKYSQLIQDNKVTDTTNKQLQKAVVTLKHEKDQLQNESNRLILQKDKLETLCRELQRQNKLVQEESLSRMKVEENKRIEVSDHFQTSIKSIQDQLNEYQSRNNQLRNENQELADKLLQFIAQHEQREEHVNKLMQTRELEIKLVETKLSKAQCLLDQEKAKSQQKLLTMEQEMKNLESRLEIQKTIEEKLREQITFYKEKYNNFNKTMVQSKKMFNNAKDEMDKLADRIRFAEREAVEWRGKWEISQHSLLEVAEQCKKEAAESATLKKQLDVLGGVCRALQKQIADSRTSNTATDPVANQTSNSESCENKEEEEKEKETEIVK